MSKATQSVTSAVIDAACEWLIFMHEEMPARKDRARFVDWLLESPVHVKEYLVAEALWSDLGCIDYNGNVDAETPFQQSNVVSL